MTAELSDISVGTVEGKEGWNTVIVRTAMGEDLLRRAKKAGVIETRPLPKNNLNHLKEASLLKKRRALDALNEKGGIEKGYFTLSANLIKRILSEIRGYIIMSSISQNAPGKTVLLMGNEAIARGALEAGVKVCAAYPGNPSSEIIGTLAKVAEEMGLHVEWSINEKVALEVAAAASFAGLRGLCAMKQNGLNVASDFLLNLNLSGSRGGLVLVVADDPAGVSSSNEEDSRIYAKLGDLPLLEPANFQEAKEMTKSAFEISEQLGLPVLIRSVTRVSHATGECVSR